MSGCITHDRSSASSTPICEGCGQEISGRVLRRDFASWCRPCHSGKPLPVFEGGNRGIVARSIHTPLTELELRTVNAPPPPAQPYVRPSKYTEAGHKRDSDIAQSRARSMRIITRVEQGMSWREAALPELVSTDDECTLDAYMTRAKGYRSSHFPDVKVKVDPDLYSEVIIAYRAQGLSWPEAARLSGSPEPERDMWRAQAVLKNRKKRLQRLNPGSSNVTGEP